MTIRTTPFAFGPFAFGPFAAGLLAPLGLALAALLAVPAPAAEPLDPGQRFTLHCAAAFARVAAGQAQGDPALAAYPPLAERGREYFVRAGAEAMDAAGLTREELQTHLQAEMAALAEPGALEQVMPLCLKSLEESGL